MSTGKELQVKQQEITAFFNDPITMQKIKNALPNIGITPERMLRMAYTAIQTTPKLSECTIPSLYEALIQSATLGLEPNTPLGHAYIIPYGNKAQFQIGYRGLLALCHRTKSILPMAYVVHEGDKFEYQLGTSAYIKHIPSENAEDTPLTHAYSIATWEGQVTFDVMTKKQIDRIRNRSQASKSGPWVTDYDEMSKKTVAKRHLKWLPLSPELANALQIDGENEGEQLPVIDISLEKPAPKETKLSQMAKEVTSPVPEKSTPETTSPPEPPEIPLNELQQRLISEIGVDLLAISMTELVAEKKIPQKLVSQLTNEECVKINMRANAILDREVATQ